MNNEESIETTTRSFGSDTASRRAFMGKIAAGGGLALGATTGIVSLDSMLKPANANVVQALFTREYLVPSTDTTLTVTSWTRDVAGTFRQFSRIDDSDGTHLAEFDIDQSRLLSDDIADLDGLSTTATSISTEEVLYDTADHGYHARRLTVDRPGVAEEIISYGSTYTLDNITTRAYSSIQIAEYSNLVNSASKLLQIDIYEEGQWRRRQALPTWPNFETISYYAETCRATWIALKAELALGVTVLGVAAHVMMGIITSHVGVVAGVGAITEFINEGWIGGLVLLIAATVLGAAIAITYMFFWDAVRILKDELADRDYTVV